MADHTPLLVLIDGHALVHRAYHAFAAASGRNAVAMTTRAGEPTTAVYGFASMLLKVMGEYRPTHIICAFDTHVPTFRHEQYLEYKATRTRMPDDLSAQFGRVRELLEAFAIPIYEMDGYEADDVLGALSHQAAGQGVETMIVTGDADTMQLVRPGVRILYPGTRALTDATLYDENRVFERYGVPPNRVPDWKGLKGDPSDNIPGVPGVGDKTASRLLQLYDTVEGVYEHLDEVAPPRLQQLLRDHRDQALHSKWLATITLEVPITLDLDGSHVRAYDRARVVRLLRELEFNSLLSRLPEQQTPAPSAGAAVQLGLTLNAGDDVAQGDVAQAPSPATSGPQPPSPAIPGPQLSSPEKGVVAVGSRSLPGGDYHTVGSPEELESLVRRLSEARSLVFDVETNNLRPTEAGLVGISLSPGPGEAYYVPVGHQPGLGGAGNLPLDLVRVALARPLADPGLPKAAHNANYDLIVLAEHGLPVEPLASDTMIAAFLLGEKALGLNALAFNKLGIEMSSISELTGTGVRQLTIDRVPVDQVCPYACAGADLTSRLREALEEGLQREGLWDLYTRVEMPLVPVLVQMERWGIALDSAVLGTMGRDMLQRMAALETAIYGDVGHQFNINSTQQLGQILFGELHLPHGRKTKTGWSTDVRVLNALRDAHPVVDNVLEFRQLSKLKSTYLDALPGLVNRRTGRLHTSFNQTGAATGRISSQDPNLQNIPIRTELGRQVRTAFIGADGCRLMSADYSQVELRVLAELSRDQGLIDAFLADEDIHNATASTVFGVASTNVTADHRRIAKVVNFGIVYGLSGFGLTQAIPGMARAEAEEFIRTYFARYPGIKEYITRTIQEGGERGYVETFLGRRRYIPELLHANSQVRAAAERMAINMPVQGTAADVIKIAMVRLLDRLRNDGYKTKMILQVHDELLFEIPPDELDDMNRLVPDIMSSAVQMAVPLKVEVKVGANWGELEEVEEGAEELYAVTEA